MKRAIICLGAILPILTASLSTGSITGSAHDFTGVSWGDESICKPCHTPHNAVATAFDGRLWAHTLSAQTSYIAHGGWTPASDQSADAEARTSVPATDLDGPTRLCLSCHDGTVALDSFLGKSGASDGMGIGQGAGHGASTANLGTDLFDDHPVGYRTLYLENISYAGVFAYKPFASLPPSMKFISSPTAVPTGAVDQNGKPITYTSWPAISCITCHDVHNTNAPAERGLLRVSNINNQLCISCHNK